MAREDIRPIRMRDAAAHLEGAAALEALCFAEPWSVPSLRILTREGTGAGFLCAAPEDPDRFVAYGGLLIAADEGLITNVAVHPAYRGRGYGRAVVRALLRFAESAGLASVSLEARASNGIALALYRSEGFREVGRRRGSYRKPTEDAIVLARAIG